MTNKQPVVEIVLAPVSAEIPAGADCSACGASCQSACKTSCTVGNQPCTALEPEQV